MTRVKKAVHALKNRRTTLRQTKGFRLRRANTERAANEALAHAGAYAFAHRRDKKGDFRRLWNVKINAGLRAISVSCMKPGAVLIKLSRNPSHTPGMPDNI